MLRFQSPPSVSQETSVNETPPGSPPGTLWRELPISTPFFYVSLGFPIKSSPVRKISPLFLSPWERTFPTRVPSKGAFPSGSLHRSPIERETLFPEPSICLSKSLVNEPPYRFPNGASMERCSFPEPSFTHPLIKTKSHLSLKVPSKGAPTPLHVPKMGPLWRKALPSPQPVVDSFIYISQSPQLRSSPTM
jgi:hypothetical protein